MKEARDTLKAIEEKQKAEIASLPNRKIKRIYASIRKHGGTHDEAFKAAMQSLPRR